MATTALSTMLPPASREAPARAPVHSDEEWAKYQDLIVGMYPLDGMSNKKVVQMLSDDHGFVVTERQLRRKLQSWDIRKNIRSDKMKVIAKKQRQRMAEGKETNFRFRGKPVKTWDINRWQKRTENNILIHQEQHESESPTPSTPSDISYSTVGSPFQTPATVQQYSTHSSSSTEVVFARVPEIAREQTTAQSNQSVASDSININFLLNKSRFEGQSPAPFTAPPSPVVESIPVAAGPVTAAGLSNAPMIAIPEGYHSSISGVPNAPALNNIPYNGSSQIHNVRGEQRASECVPTSSTRKVRYKQREEDELTQRMNDMLARLGEDHPATLDTMSRLAYVYKDQSRYKTAGLLGERIVKGWQRSVGDNDPRTIISLRNFAYILTLQGELKTSEELLRATLAKAITNMHPTDTIILSLKSVLGNNLCSMGKFLEAETLFRDILREGRKLKPDDNELLIVMQQLALILCQRGAYEESLRILQTVLTTRELSQQDGLSLFPLLLSMSQIYIETGEFQKAEDILTQVLKEHRTLLGDEHYIVLQIQFVLGRNHMVQGRSSDAEVLFRDSLVKFRRTLGHQHFDTLRTESVLAGCLNSQERFVEAEALAKRVLLVLESQQTQNADSFANAAMAAGKACHSQGRSAEGLELLKKALSMNIDHYGHDHRYTSRVRTMVKIVEGQISNTHNSPQNIEPSIAWLNQNHSWS